MKLEHVPAFWTCILSNSYSPAPPWPAHRQGNLFPKAFNGFQRAALISLPCPRPSPELLGTAHLRKPAGTGREDAASLLAAPMDAIPKLGSWPSQLRVQRPDLPDGHISPSSTAGTAGSSVVPQPPFAPGLHVLGVAVAPLQHR